MPWKQKYSPKHTPAVALSNLLNFCEDIIKEESDKPSRSQVYTVIKMLTDKILHQHSLSIIHGKEYQAQGYGDNMGFYKLLGVSRDNKDLFPKVQSKVKLMELENRCITIRLATDPVLSKVYEKKKIASKVATVGTPANPWKEDTINHMATLYLPLGVTFVSNGNHSVLSGILKRQGTLLITETSQHQVKSIGNLLRYMYFDGANYREIVGDKYLFKGNSFEFGCIFEIGRLLEKHRLSFVPRKLEWKKSGSTCPEVGIV